ncbi:unnamed protein product, partial [Mesorhabditis spiculigera]
MVEPQFDFPQRRGRSIAAPCSVRRNPSSGWWFHQKEVRFRSVSLSRNFKRQDNTLGLLKSLRLSAGPTMNRRGGGNHGSGPIPDRWLQYLPIGKHIEQTRFLPLKCPLDKKFFMRNRCSDEQLFTIDCLLAMAGNVNKKIGLIIDLTNTHRYYNPEEFTSQGIQHVKLQCPGHEVDGREDIVREFIQIVDNYLAVAPPDTLIGVHCTHGLNRTGYLIGRYLIQKGDWNADEYLQMFEHCRGHPIEREAYKAKLRWAQEQRDAILKQNVDT